MKKRLIITIVIAITFMGSCSPVLDDSCFNGPIRLIDDDVNVEEVTLEEVRLDGPFFGIPTISGDYIIFRNNKLTQSFFQIFDLQTGAYIGDFVHRGGGPGEVYAVPYIFQVYEDGGSMKTLVSATNEQELLEWNISESIKRGETVIDTVIPYENNPDGSYLYLFRLDDDTLVTRIDANPMSMDGDIASVPYYQKRTIYSNQPISDIRMYNHQTVQQGDVAKIPPFFYHTSTDRIKPDRTKIVQVMGYLGQINIIDLATGRTTGHRIKNTPDFSIFYSGIRDLDWYYSRVQADDNYIYALYFGKANSRASEGEAPDLIHVFDWNGTLVKKLKLEYPVREMAIDITHNALYFLDATDDVFYRCDLNTLNL